CSPMVMWILTLLSSSLVGAVLSVLGDVVGLLLVGAVCGGVSSPGSGWPQPAPVVAIAKESTTVRSLLDIGIAITA
ncbi:MAG: hypothetical protein ABWX59_01145, partial [Microbacteriaceae bacterium]